MNSFFVGVALGAVVGGVAGLWVGRHAKRAAPEFTPEDTGQLTAAQTALRERTARRHERILHAARTAGRIANDDVEDLFCISDRTASKYLRELTEAGRLEQRGRGRGTHYVPTK